MGWFRNWFRKMSEQAWNDSHFMNKDDLSPVKASKTSRGRSGLMVGRPPMEKYEYVQSLEGNFPTNFNMYTANGGYVIELKRYDRHNDLWINSLHVITEDQDLGNSLAKIITMDALQR